MRIEKGSDSRVRVVGGKYDGAYGTLQTAEDGTVVLLLDDGEHLVVEHAQTGQSMPRELGS